MADEAAATVRAALPESPRVAIILGSGLSEFAENLSNRTIIPYDRIPHYPKLTVPGHVGELVFGYLNQTPVLVARGRFHYYEGYSLETVALPVRLLARVGVKALVITNAAGCVRRDWQVGDLMLITGHLDYTFIDNADDPQIISGEPYHSDELAAIAREAASTEGITLREGVYSWSLGPTFETPAEIRDIRRLGGAAVGMSTVPEIRAAADEGLQVLGLSCLTNYAAGILDQPLNHEEVLETGQRVKHTFARLLMAIIVKIEA
ncbi:MAG: purine-nucleoside phosphorylase [Candidatus Marinimicrobia bacterium]|nr:purine-nucleoside phosphorylase [Candidatus Neomarinimicrobiota bacterium]